MKNKITIYAGEPIQRLFERDTKSSVSGRLNQVVDRYQLVCEHHGLGLTMSELELLKIAYAGKKKITGADILNYEMLISAVINPYDPMSMLLIDSIKTATLADFVATLDILGL